jgi:hypothetical protein
MRRARWVTVLPVAPAAGCAGAGAPTTPTGGGPEGVAFTHGGHDLNLLAENRDVFFVPAGAYER